MRYVWRHPVLRPLMLAAGVFNMGAAALSAILVLWLVGPESAAGFSPPLPKRKKAAAPAAPRAITTTPTRRRVRPREDPEPSDPMLKAGPLPSSGGATTVS